MEKVNRNLAVLCLAMIAFLLAMDVPLQLTVSYVLGVALLVTNYVTYFAIRRGDMPSSRILRLADRVLDGNPYTVLVSCTALFILGVVLYAVSLMAFIRPDIRPVSGGACTGLVILELGVSVILAAEHVRLVLKRVGSAT